MPMLPVPYDDDVGQSQYTATFNVIYKAKYTGVTNVPSGSSSSSTGTNPNSSVWLGIKVSDKIPVREGYDFVGWKLYDNDERPITNPGDNLTAYVRYGSTVTYDLWSRWEIKKNTITYNSNGGDGSPVTQSKDYGSSVSILSLTPTRTGYVFVKWNTAINGTGDDYVAGQSYSANADLQLYAVWKPAASVPTVNKESVNVGGSITISTNRFDSTAVHTLTYSFEGQTGNIATNVTTSKTWTIPNSFYAKLTDKVSAVCTIYCTTFIGGVQSGDTQSVIFTVTVPEGEKPTLTVTTTAVNDSAISSILNGAYVQGYSQVQFSFSAAFTNQSTLGSYVISGPDLPSVIDTTSSTVLTNVLSGSGSLKWTVYVVDSRGRASDAIEVSLNVLAYSRPSISPISMYRCDQNGNQNQASGTYLNTRAFYSAVNVGSNTITSAKVYYRRSSGASTSGWTQAIDLSSQTGAGSGLWTGAIGGGNIALEYSYEVKYEVQDSIGAAKNLSSVYVISYPIPSSAGVSYGIYNDRLRLGGLVEEPGFVVDWATKFKNPVTIQNLDAYGMTGLIVGEGDNICLLLTGNK